MSERSPRKPSPRPTRTVADSWTPADYEDKGRVATFGHRVVLRRRRTRARVKAMPRGRRVTRRLLILGTWFLGFMAVLMVGVIVAYFQFTDVPRPEDLAAANQQVATIQYSDGSTLARIGSLDRTIVDLSEVPESTRWAVLAAEDRKFYSNGAVSITGTLRAALTDLTGGERQGGSGITQQYVKNAYLTDDPTLTRKLKELMIAVKLSRDYSKDEILGFYLNTVYFGRGAYGIEAAAKVFFGEDVSKLTVAQGAMLAGLLRAPSYYDPAQNPTQSKARWNYVVQGMVTTGHLTSAQASSLTFPKTKAPPTSNGIGTKGWKFLLVNAVLSELQAHGISTDEVYQRGLTIRTTIDRRAQSAALSAINTVFKNPTAKQKNLKNALVAVQPSTGGILAYYPGTGPGVKGLDGQINYNDWAQQRANAPGSSFKPYVLATVLQQTLDQTPGDGKVHYAINSVVDGSFKKTIQGTVIRNDPGDKSVSGPAVTIAHAMRYSLNTTFDDLAVQAGPSNVAAMAHKLGVAATDSDGRKTLVSANGDTSFGIGIGDYPVTPLDQASGYATLANGGVRNTSYMVQQVTGTDGSVVYRHEKAPKQVIDTRIANDVTLTLEKVAGDAGDALAGGRASAAKTGTEGVSGASVNNSDAWMVGYTPQVSAAVWVGTGAKAPIYDSNGNPMYGREEPAQTWKLFMDTYLSAINAPKEKLATRQLLSADGKTVTVAPTTVAPVTTPPASSSNPATVSTSAFPSTSAPAPVTSVPVAPTTPVVAPSTPGVGTTCGLLGGGVCQTP